MKTEHLEETIYDYVTKRMDEKAYRLAEEHVKGCMECQREVDELKETLKLLNKFEPLPMSEEFKEAVKQRLYKLPLPRKPLSYRIKEWIQNRPINLSLKGLAVAAIILLTFTIYRNFIPQKQQEIERTRELKITLSEVKNPIIIETENVESGLEQIRKFIQAHNGQVLQTIQIDKGMKITVSLEKDKEQLLFTELNKIGKVQIEKEGYKDEKGNIVMLLKEK